MVWGCDSSAGATAPSFVPGSETLAAPGGPPCYDYQTLGDLLDAKNVSWKYYSGKVGTADGAIGAYDAVKHIHDIEKNWGLGSLGQRDAVADDLSSMFDYRRKPIPAAFGFVTQASSRARSPQSVRSPLENYSGHSYTLDDYKNLISARPLDGDK